MQSRDGGAREREVSADFVGVSESVIFPAQWALISEALPNTVQPCRRLIEGALNLTIKDKMLRITMFAWFCESDLLCRWMDLRRADVQ